MIETSDSESLLSSELECFNSDWTSDNPRLQYWPMSLALFLLRGLAAGLHVVDCCRLNSPYGASCWIVYLISRYPLFEDVPLSVTETIVGIPIFIWDKDFHPPSPLLPVCLARDTMYSRSHGARHAGTCTSIRVYFNGLNDASYFGMIPTTFQRRYPAEALTSRCLHSYPHSATLQVAMVLLKIPTIACCKKSSLLIAIHSLNIQKIEFYSHTLNIRNIKAMPLNNSSHGSV